MLNVKKNQKEMTICPLCDEPYTDARTLPGCLHTFCLQCLQKRELAVVESSCPVCGEKYSGPPENLARNTFVQKLVKLSRIAGGAVSQQSPCDVCQQGDSSASPVVFATHYCLNCSESLCDKCYTMHSRIRFCLPACLPLAVLVTRVGRTMNNLSRLMSVFHIPY